MAKGLRIFHVVDHFISGRHWVVLATSKASAIDKVLERVPDIEPAVLQAPGERLEATATDDWDFTEVCAEIKVTW